MYIEGTANYIMWITLFESYDEARDSEVALHLYLMLIAAGLSDVKRAYKSAVLPFRRVHISMQLLLISVCLSVYAYVIKRTENKWKNLY
jgi:hypothetical protein